MELKLVREYMGDDFTEGKLYVDGVFECYIVEDKDRQLEVHGCAAKVKGKTCIPRGRYECIIRYSQRFKKHLIAITGVPCFDGILIHSGNSSADTDGCVIVGATNKSMSDDWVGNSRLAYDALHRKVKAALSRGEKVWIEVV